MPAAIWLRVSGRQEQALQRVIDTTARAHGTVAFPPHLTVCGIPDLAVVDAVGAYVRESALLPIRVAKAGVTAAMITPFRAVFIEVENSRQLSDFRERLREIAGAPEFDPPHISLLYTLDHRTQRPRLDLDAVKLAAIACQSAAQIGDAGFTLARPVIVGCDGEWINVRSWKVIRAL
jgi:hypothetical protein